jgi:peroxiredoxin
MRKVKILGLSRDSAESHRNFIAKHGLHKMTLLVDEKGKIAKLYEADHWLLPISRRVYLIIDQNRNIIYRKDMGFALLPDQTQTLIGEIDRGIQ